MRVCPKCGHVENPHWKPLFWKMYWEYISLEDFGKVPLFNIERKHQSIGNFWYNFEDNFYYYKIAGKTRKMIHRFPKGYESMGNKKLYEKTPSEANFHLEAETK